VFTGLINNAKAAVSGLLLKYVARASVAIPFVIALGFGLAAITLTLVERFGHVIAYWMMAGGLALIGVIAAIAVSVKENEEEAAEKQAEEADTNQVVSDATAQALRQAPLAVLGALFSAPGGATTAVKVSQIIARNWPLALLLVLIGALFWPAENTAEEVNDLESASKPNGLHSAETYH